MFGRASTTARGKDCVFRPTPNCQFCDEPVAHTTSDDVVSCAKPGCQRAATQLKAETHRKKHQQDIAGARAFLRENGWSTQQSQTVSIGLVPYTDRQLKPADRNRQAEFLVNLEAALHDFLAPDYEYENRAIDYGPEGFDSAHIAACTACRGDCCKLGDTHAFLKPYRLEKLINRDEDDALEKALERYASHLPDLSIEQSCVFHTDKGCALPRDIRADECNRYRCNELQSIEVLVETPGAGPLVAVALEDGVPKNFAAADSKTAFD